MFPASLFSWEKQGLIKDSINRIPIKQAECFLKIVSVKCDTSWDTEI